MSNKNNKNKFIKVQKVMNFNITNKIIKALMKSIKNNKIIITKNKERFEEVIKIIQRI